MVNLHHSAGQVENDESEGRVAYDSGGRGVLLSTRMGGIHDCLLGYDGRWDSYACWEAVSCGIGTRSEPSGPVGGEDGLDEMSCYFRELRASSVGVPYMPYFLEGEGW
jgi:hypothetical protein